MSLADELCGPRVEVEPGTKNVDALKRRIAAMRTQGDLKRLLREEGGLSRAEASAVFKGLMTEVETKEAEPITTRAGTARAFRDARQRQEERQQFLRDSLKFEIAWEVKQAVSDRLPGGLEKAAEDRWFAQYSNRHDAAERAIADRLLTELEQQIDGCKDADEVEALLVRRVPPWPDARIAEYMRRFT